MSIRYQEPLSKFPPADFDPLRVSDAELARFSLPQRPNERTQPQLLKAWLRLFQQPLKFTSPIIEDRLFIRQFPENRRAPSVTSRFETSRNWCGASIVPHDGDQFVMLFGEWNVPEPSLPPGAMPPDKDEAVYKCTTWIGLDGNRGYRNSSLPQIGTEQTLKVGANGSLNHEYGVWFQWWARDQLKPNLETVVGVDVAAGMSVMGMVWAIAPSRVVAVFRNFAPKNQITMLVRDAPPIKIEGGKVAKPTISGATAEWIMERRAELVLEDAALLPFPSYTPVTFSQCVAGTAHDTSLPTSEETLLTARFFRMFEVLDGPPRTHFISMPEPQDATTVGVRYGDFKD